MKSRILVLLFVFLAGCATESQMRRRVVSDYCKRVDPISITDQDAYRRDFEECCAQAFPHRMQAEQTYVVGSIVYGSQEARVQSDKLSDRADLVFGNCMLNRGYKLFW